VRVGWDCPAGRELSLDPDSPLHPTAVVDREGKFRTRVRDMSKFTDKVKALFQRSRPVSREDAVEIADWVNEGGTFDPDGPPPVIDDERESK
jgi:hypothetical protein